MTDRNIDPERWLWDTVDELVRRVQHIEEEITQNGYGPILRDFAQRLQRRQQFWRHAWHVTSNPRRWLARIIWLIIGAGIFVYIDHFFVKVPVVSH